MTTVRTCELCGEPDEVEEVIGWICDTCLRDRDLWWLAKVKTKGERNNDTPRTNNI